MTRILISVVLACPAAALACPEAVVDSHFDANTRRDVELVCPAGETLRGFVYRSFTSWGITDMADDIGLLCSGGEVRVDADLGPGPDTTVDCGAMLEVRGIRIDRQLAGSVEGIDGVDTLCGPALKQTGNPDLDDSVSSELLVCPRGLTAVGVRYKDLDATTFSDLADAVALLCDGPQGITEVVSAEWHANGRLPAELVCDPGEVVTAVATDDLYVPGATDFADGFAITCTDPSDPRSSHVLLETLDIDHDPSDDTVVDCGGDALTGLAVAETIAFNRARIDGADALCGPLQVATGGAGLDTHDPSYEELGCPPGQVLVGLGYKDADTLTWSDPVDSVAAICAPTECF